MQRHAPGRPFPACAFVPGYSPRPRRSFGDPPDLPQEALDPQTWRCCEPYLWGIDLFNHGYYWEAHEAWEGLWHAALRSGAIGALLKGLIRLAAAGVKVRQGNPESVRNHAEAARRQFLLAQQAAQERLLCGLSLEGLGEFALRVAHDAHRWHGDPELAVEIVFDQALVVEQ